MRRTLAGFLFGFAYFCAALCIAGWFLQRTAFNPSRTASVATEILQVPAIRAEIVGLIAENAAPTLGTTPEAVSGVVNGYLEDPTTEAAMSREMAGILEEAHAHLIGQQSEPVQITDAQIRNIVRNDAVMGLAPITLPIPEVHVLSVTRDVLRWLVPISGIAAVVFGLIGLTAHPDRQALLRSLGFGMLLLAVLITGLGYFVPRFAIPALSDSPWAQIPAKLANDALPLIIALDFVFVGAGIALLVGSGLIRRRRRWSSPVSTYRYHEQRHWS
ncbi:MAG: hypothetical protein QM733_22435 [Ilumatobacteraceae bacterium]